MALNDLGNQNIQDTYRKVVQTEGNTFADGSGSAITTFNVTSSHAVSASYALSASHEITYELSSSYAVNADTASFATNFTASGDISASGIIQGANLIATSLKTKDNENLIRYHAASDTVRVGIHTDNSHPLSLQGHVTASGNISSSAAIYGTKFQAYNGIFSGSYLTSNKLAIHETDSDIEAFEVESSANKSSLIMRYGTTGRVYIDPINDSYIWTNGDLGIGHNSPSYKLDVNGTGRFSTTLLVGSTLTGQGSSIFGITHPSHGNINTHTFIGHITASDNISGSAAGTVSAGSGSFHVLKGDTTAATGLSVAGYIEATNITASGNISASGNITAKLDNNGGILLGSANALSGDAGNILYLGNNNTWEQIIYGRESTDQHTFNGHITASNDISSSGNIFASTVNVNEIVGTIATAAQTQITSVGPLSSITSTGNSILGNATSDTHTFTGHITASGNISASGNVYAKDYFDDGTNINTLYDLTPTGTISSSAQLPSGILSSSAQLPAGVISSSLHIFTALTSSGNISASDNIYAKDYFDDGVNINTLYDLTPTGTISSSAQLPSGILSSSAQLPSGILSSSAQLPSGIISSSLQNLGNITGSNISASGNYIGNRQFNQSTSTDNNQTQGDIVYFGTHGSISEGDVVYLKTNGNWEPANNNAEETATSMLGICLGAAITDGILIKGPYTLDHNLGNTQTGKPLYLSSTNGQATATVPSSDFVRIIGYQLGDDDEIWFDPDKTWVEL